MNGVRLAAGFISLVDATPLILAYELGFAEEERLALDLMAAPSWSTLRDMLALGRVDAAQLLSPMPLVIARGLGGTPAHSDALSVISVNGTVIGVSTALAAKLRSAGYSFDFADTSAAGLAGLLLPGRAIWALAPEKVRAVRRDRAAERPGVAGDQGGVALA